MVQLQSLNRASAIQTLTGVSIDGNAGTVTGGGLYNRKSNNWWGQNRASIPAFNGGLTGTSAPFTVDSTFLVTNLNSDLLDGQHGSYYATVVKLTGDQTIAGVKTIQGSVSGNAGTVTNGCLYNWYGVKTFTDIPVFNGGTTGSSAPFKVDFNILSYKLKC